MPYNEISYPELIAATDPDKLIQLSSDVFFYHTVQLADGAVADGFFDQRRYLDQYGFPEQMAGKRVLDVGSAGGYFAFEFERRGAEVVATELSGFFDKDYIGGPITKSLFRHASDAGMQRLDRKLLSQNGKRLDFPLAHKVLGSKVRWVCANLSDLTLDTVGGEPFDLVFVGAVLNHVRDPAGALERLFSVTRGKVIIANPVDDQVQTDQPILRHIGLTSPSNQLTTWFVPNVPALTLLLQAAGFTNVQVRTALLYIEAKKKMRVPHCIIHADRPSDAAARSSFLSRLKRGYPEIFANVE